MNTTKVTGKRKRRRYTRAEALAAVSGYKQSGLTQVAYAEAAGIKVGSLRKWITRGTPGARRGTELAAVQLVPVVPSRSAKVPAAANATTLTIQWPSGARAEVRLGSDASEAVGWLRELLT